MTEHPDAGTAIECSDVSLVRGRWQRVLDRVSLKVPPGAVVGLVGRNGAGKSTLMQCLVGLTIPDSGRCALLGDDASQLSDAVRERLGYVAQQPDLFPWLSGEAHFRRFGAAYRRWSDRRAVELALRLDLKLTTAAGKLSGGDQQKLSVVLAMAHDPDLLILDEPVAGLDPLTRREFMRCLFERATDVVTPRTILVSSHLLGDLERVVTHVAFLRDGRLQFMDERDALTEHVRLLELPVGHSALPQRVIHRHSQGGVTRAVFDARVADAPPGAGRALTLDDLFVELNTGPMTTPGTPTGSSAGAHGDVH